MSAVLSADEAKTNYIKMMGEPLGSLFHALWQEVAWLYHEWHEYVVLFGDKSSRVLLLNKAAPTFFSLIQGLLWEGILLHIARLTDPPQSVGKRNLTIQALAPLIPDPKTAQKVNILTQEAVQSADFCRDWRNRRIAHRDLSLSLSSNVKRLKSASHEKVNVTLSHIAEVMNAVSLHHMKSTSFFDTPNPPGGAISLLYILNEGIKTKVKKLERMKRGEFLPDDFSNRDL